MCTHDDYDSLHVLRIILIPIMSMLRMIVIYITSFLVMIVSHTVCAQFGCDSIFPVFIFTVLTWLSMAVTHTVTMVPFCQYSVYLSLTLSTSSGCRDRLTVLFVRTQRDSRPKLSIFNCQDEQERNCGFP